MHKINEIVYIQGAKIFKIINRRIFKSSFISNSQSGPFFSIIKWQIWIITIIFKWFSGVDFLRSKLAKYVVYIEC